MKSKCCGHPVTVLYDLSYRNSADTKGSYYQCDKCFNTCDIVSKHIIELSDSYKEVAVEGIILTLSNLDKYVYVYRSVNKLYLYSSKDYPVAKSHGDLLCEVILNIDESLYRNLIWKIGDDGKALLIDR